MLAKLSDGWKNGLRITFVLVVSLAVGLLVWFIASRGADDGQQATQPVAENTPLPVDEAGIPDAPIPLDFDLETEAVGTDAVEELPSKEVETPEPDFSWSGWQLASIDGVEVSATGDTTVRCRAMSTDRIPDAQVLNQLAYQISQSDEFDSANIHISQINNYYRCDLDLEWSAIVVGYEPGICLDLSPLNGALSLTTGRNAEVAEHPAWAPWIGADCSADPALAGQVSIELSSADALPVLAEVTYEGTFRVFVPKNDYSKIISSIQVEVEPGVYGILESIRIKRL